MGTLHGAYQAYGVTLQPIQQINPGFRIFSRLYYLYLTAAGRLNMGSGSE